MNAAGNTAIDKILASIPAHATAQFVRTWYFLACHTYIPFANGVNR